MSFGNRGCINEHYIWIVFFVDNFFFISDYYQWDFIILINIKNWFQISFDIEQLVNYNYFNTVIIFINLLNQNNINRNDKFIRWNSSNLDTFLQEGMSVVYFISVM